MHAEAQQTKPKHSAGYHVSKCRPDSQALQDDDEKDASQGNQEARRRKLA
jgi:hypothetical protein